MGTSIGYRNRFRYDSDKIIGIEFDTIPISEKSNRYQVCTISMYDTWKLSFSTCMKNTGMEGKTRSIRFIDNSILRYIESFDALFNTNKDDTIYRKFRYDLSSFRYLNISKVAIRYPTQIGTI